MKQFVVSVWVAATASLAAAQGTNAEQVSTPLPRLVEEEPVAPNATQPPPAPPLVAPESRESWLPVRIHTPAPDVIIQAPMPANATSVMPAQAPELLVKAGELLSERLVAWSRQHGYDMAWYAGQYRSNGELRLQSGFDEGLEAVAGAMRQNKIYLKFEVFRNKTVRVTEVKQ